MNGTFMSLFVVGVLLNSVITGLVGLALLKRNRYVFRQTLELRELLKDLTIRLRTEMRQQDVLCHSSRIADCVLPPRFTSQFGEDILVYDYFRGRQPGFFVEAGAFDGVTISNTYLLESLGWRGLLVEANPTYAEKCQVSRPASKVVNAALGSINAAGDVDFTCLDERGAALSFLNATPEHRAWCQRLGAMSHHVRVPFTNLNRILDGETEKVDLLSLDLEGMELEALQGFDLKKYRPEVLIIEHANDSSDSTLVVYLRERGYHAEGRRGCNIFFICEAKREEFRAILYPEDKMKWISEVAQVPPGEEL